VTFDVIGNAEKVVGPLRATVDESESLRRLSDRAVALLHESGATRLVSPARYGGYELSPRALVEAERILAHGSPAASWVLMVTGAHTFIAGRLPVEGQDEVFGADAGMLIPGGPTPRGTCTPTDGGYVLNGRWPYASGVDFGDWVMVGARGVPNAAGERCATQVVVIPKKNVVIDDTWFTLGMRGTGSKDIVLDEVFVPHRHAVRMDMASLGTVPGVDIPLYRLPILATLGTMLLGTIVGMAERGLGLFVEQARTRRDAYSGAEKVSSVLLQQRVAEASGEIACAWALTQQSCDLLEAARERDEPMPIGPRAQVRWNVSYASELCRRAFDRLYAGAGAGAAHDGNVLQSVFRDVNTATHHALLDFDTNIEIQGKHLLGVQLDEALV
jgi:alkylation response protein AidB-like acyl-CoA dehydrogenase